MDQNLKYLIKSRLIEILKIKEKILEMQKKMQEGDVSPFFLGLFGEKLSFTVKIGQSIQTTLGMSFYEQAIKAMGEFVGYKVETQKKLIGYIYPEVEDYLKILDRLDYKPDRDAEIKKIREICKSNFIKTSPKLIEYPDSTIDVYVTTPDGEEILIDVTTIKNNKKSFRAMKKTSLRWAAYRMSQDPDVNVQPYFAIPYNPESKRVDGIIYERFGNYYDRKDILVGDELWKKVSNNKCSINDIIDIFNELGDEMNEEISAIFNTMS